MRFTTSTVRLRLGAAAAAAGMALAGVALLPPGAAHAASPANSSGLRQGTIKHVWLIILENKSFDATFTGLNDNTYLWQTLPSQGVLLKDYFGTGHFSLDNYVSLVSGQATQPDNQADCPTYKDFAVSGLDADGQAVSAAGPNGAVGANGCVYPPSVQTLFNQLDAAGVSWKGYAQDLHNTPGREDAACGGPGDPAGAGVANPGSATATDQYVPKHFPFPWFHSLIDNPTDCTTAHIADLFGPATGLFHDLQSTATTPAFSWISPDNCSDAHDAVCHGNNLSGGFSDPNTPNPPANYTGGLYASDLFLEHVIPEIEQSPAFKDGGLIDVTFDEGFPAFTFTGNSFNNSRTDPPTAASSIASDSAGENIDGHNVNTEPTGPNTPLATDASGNQLYPGPGDNAFIDRPSGVPGLILGGGSSVPGPRTDAGAVGSAAATTIDDNSISITDVGRGVTGANIPANCTVGAVSDTGPQFPIVPVQSGGGAVTGSFTLDCNGTPTVPAGPVSEITLAARTASTDPLFNATDPTTGGGDTGSVLISPFIQPGTSTAVFYNHYSWLRTMEDLFGVGKASPGLDGEGHLGYAAQAGLRPFGPDVFNNPHGHHNPGGQGNESAAALPVGAVVLGGAAFATRRRRGRKGAVLAG